MGFKVRSKIIRNHKRGCYALAAAAKNAWPHPWSVPSGDVHRLDLMGRRNGGGRRWIEYRCNDADCPALLAVLEDDFLAQAAWGNEVNKP